MGPCITLRRANNGQFRSLCRLICTEPGHLPCLLKDSLYKAAFRASGRGLNGSLIWGRIFAIRFPVSPPSLAATSLSGLEGLSAGVVRIFWSRKGSPMALYEHIFLARQDISGQQVEALTAQFKSVIESFGGKVEKVEYWGVRSLAYRIKKNRKAHFSLLNIDAPPAALSEMERQMGINEDIIRFLTVRVEALEQGPSAMMRKRDDDERGRGGRGDKTSKRPRDEALEMDEVNF
jgi:small subunit ribosomal protein S6